MHVFLNSTLEEGGGDSFTVFGLYPCSQQHRFDTMFGTAYSRSRRYHEKSRGQTPVSTPASHFSVLPLPSHCQFIWAGREVAVPISCNSLVTVTGWVVIWLSPSTQYKYSTAHQAFLTRPFHALFDSTQWCDAISTQLLSSLLKTPTRPTQIKKHR
jgi:hypothetical protein